MLPNPDQYKDWKDWARALQQSFSADFSELTTKVSESLDLEGNLANGWINAVAAPNVSNASGYVAYLTREFILRGVIKVAVTPAIFVTCIILPTEFAPRRVVNLGTVISDSAGVLQPALLYVDTLGNVVCITNPGLPAGGITSLSLNGLRWQI